MTIRRFTRTTRGSLVASVFALAAVLVLGVAVDAFAPRSSEAQRSSRGDGRGFLGVSLQELTDDLRDSYDYHGDGVLVADVTADSPADRIGIEDGDILVRIGDEEIDDVQAATDYVRSLSPGTRVAITVFRDGRSRSLGRATIGDLATRNDGGDDRIAPRAPRPPRTPRSAPAPRVSPSPQVAPQPPGVRGLLMGGRGRLGVQTHDMDSDLGSYFNAPGGRGVLILDVVDDTPAKRAGLKSGDVILGVGGDEVEDTEALREALRDRGAGRVELRILRNGRSRTIDAQLDEAGSFNFQRGDGQDRSDEGGSDFRSRMTPEERTRFDERMQKLREDMRELQREMQEMRDRQR